VEAENRETRRKRVTRIDRGMCRAPCAPAVPPVHHVFGRSPVWISPGHWPSRVRFSWLFSISRSFGTNMP